jgi:D-alanine-D-alanine ligase
MKKFNTIYFAKSKIVDCSFKNSIILDEYVEKNGQEIDQFKLNVARDKKFIVVVGGGMSAEREVSFMSSNGIVNSLLELGHFVVFADMGADIAYVLQKLKPDVVFNGLHGTYGEDGCLQGVLNILRIPYTGPGVLASAIALNKKKSHFICKANGINVAEAIFVKKSDNIKNDPMPRPYVIKPLLQGSSIGVEIIFEEDDFAFANYAFEYGDEIIVEQYIKGREVQVAVLNGVAMGALEIKLLKDKRFNDYEVKYRPGFSQHLLPAPLPALAYDKILEISEYACRVFDCNSGIMRVDFIYNEKEDKFYLLEANTLPGMTSMSMCPEIVAFKGISYVELVDQILESAQFEK